MYCANGARRCDNDIVYINGRSSPLEIQSHCCCEAVRLSECDRVKWLFSQRLHFSCVRCDFLVQLSHGSELRRIIIKNIKYIVDSVVDSRIGVEQRKRLNENQCKNTDCRYDNKITVSNSLK